MNKFSEYTRIKILDRDSTGQLCNYLQPRHGKLQRVEGDVKMATVHGGTSSIIVSHRADLVKIPEYSIACVPPHNVEVTGEIVS